MANFKKSLSLDSPVFQSDDLLWELTTDFKTWSPLRKLGLGLGATD